MNKTKRAPRAGDRIPSSAAVLADRANTEKAIARTAAEIADLLVNGKLAAGRTYAVSDGAPVALHALFGKEVNGNGATLLAPAGLTVTCSTGFTLSSLAIVAEKTALSVDNLSADVVLADLRLTGATALANASTDLTVLRSAFVFTDAGLADTAANGTCVQDCRFLGAGAAVSSHASDAIYRNNTAEDGVFTVSAGAQNVLLALNEVAGIVLDHTRNTAVILNHAGDIAAAYNHAIYVCDNKIEGTFRAMENNYILADGNKAKKIETARNENENGDTLMDVDARLPVGADERLLLHVDKDLFVGMPRKSFVRDPGSAEKANLTDYLNREINEEAVVIVAPGAYAFPSDLRANKEASNTTVYAYGVYAERPEGIRRQARFDGVENFTLRGILFAFRQQSCGQVYVLDKWDENKTLRVVTGAGMVNEFCDSDSRAPGNHLFSGCGMGAQRMGTFYAYCDCWYKSGQLYKQNDGTMVMYAPDDMYARYQKGDIFTCRANNGGTTVEIVHSSGVVFRDLTMYGAAGGFAFVEGNNLTATTYYRVLNTTRSAEIIDEETYNRYRALEKQYGVSLEVYRDELGRFRGSPCHIGSIDATHTTCCAQGSVCISCLFENMCDDGTNQNHTASRVMGVTDNGDGTATVDYKGMLSQFSYQWGNRRPDIYCRDFRVGDRVYVYTAKGQLVCDTPALSATEATGDVEVPEYGTKTETYRVTVKAADVNFKALEDYDMSINTWNPENKVLLDNMSLASNGFIFDNVMVRAIRSRGLLVKSSDSKIVNCTFKHIGMSCAAILYEIYWGESGVTENFEVGRNLFDHTGYFANSDLYAPVSITGLGSRVDEDFLLYKNIDIHDNVVRNRTTDYCVYVNSAKDIRVRNNDFGTNARFPKAVHINGAMNVEIANNTFEEKKVDASDVVAEHVRNIYGKDVVTRGKHLIPDAE